VLPGSAIPTVTVDELPADVYLLDVRSAEEWAAGHAPDARFITMMEIPGRAADIPRDHEVVVVCRVGQRSAQVVAYLRAHGFENVVNLHGGMLDWAAAGRPVIGEDGRAGWIA
jgi:rhodanese-related sulfurtransferase